MIDDITCFGTYSFRSREGARIILTNIIEKPVKVTFDIYFEALSPMKSLTLTLTPERVRVLELDEPFADEKYKIPEGSFSLVLKSEAPISVSVFK